MSNGRTPSVSQRNSCGRRFHCVNWRLILVSVTTVSLLCPVAYFWHQRQTQRTAAALLQQGRRLERQHAPQRAATYYQRYLRLCPGDDDALVSLARLYASTVPCPVDGERLTQLLYQAVGRSPLCTDLRLNLAETLARTGDYDNAERQALKLLGPSCPERSQALRIAALSRWAAAQQDDSAALADAVTELIKAHNELPGDVVLAVTAANALHDHPAAALVWDQDATTLADEIMDRLVETSTSRADGLVARYRHRVRNTAYAATDDLEAALAVDGDHVDALLLLAAAKRGEGGSGADAERLLQRAIKAAPRDPRPYLALAGVREESGDAAGALAILREGRQHAPSSLEIRFALVARLIDADEMVEAEEALVRLQVCVAADAAGRDVPTQLRAESRCMLLQARLVHQRGDLATAMAKLRQVRQSSEKWPGGNQSPVRREAIALLAQVEQELGHWDRAASLWMELVSTDPREGRVAAAAAQALVSAAAPADALAVLQRFHELAEPTAETSVQVVCAQLDCQLARPPAERNWEAFSRALAATRERGIDDWRLTIAEVRFLAARCDAETPTSGDPPSTEPEPCRSARRLLRRGEDQFADRIRFWEAAARLYQQQGHSADARRAVARCEEAGGSPATVVRLQADLLAMADRYDEADQVLAAAHAGLAGDDLRRIVRIRIETMIASGRLPAAYRLLREALAAGPEDPQLLILGASLALQTRDAAAAARWLDRLETHPEYEWEQRYLAAVRDLAQVDDRSPVTDRQLAGNIARLRAGRPRWYPAVALAARYALLAGDPLIALAEYELAVKLGDRRLATLEQLVELHYGHGNLADAEKYLELVATDERSPALSKVAIQVAVTQNRLDYALEIAAQGVQQHPDQPQRRIWLANLQLAANRVQEAAETMSQAANNFPDDPRVWKGLFVLLIKTGRVEDARVVLERLVCSDMLSKAARLQIAAEGCELLGDVRDAEQRYAAAVADQPAATDLRMRLAKLLSRHNPAAATEQLEAVLQIDAGHGEARTELATLLAATGRPDDWARAEQLLEPRAGDSPACAAANDHVQAILLLKRGRNRAERLSNCRAAARLLQTRMQSGVDATAGVTGRLLCHTYEVETALTGEAAPLLAARDQLRSMATQARASREDIANYVDFLLRHSERGSLTPVSDSAIARGRSPDNPPLRATFLAEARSLLIIMQALDRRPGADIFDRLATAELLGRLRLAKGDPSAAEAITDVAQSIADETADSQPRVLYAIGNAYARVGDLSQAEVWYRRLTEKAPRAYVLTVKILVEERRFEQAAELCLKRASSPLAVKDALALAHVLTAAQAADIEMPAALAAWDEAVAAHPGHVRVLQAEALLRAGRGDDLQAVAALRTLLKEDPDNVLAMNNLATLLAEQPNRRGEALQIVSRAIDAGGRRPALLDTLGSIRLAMGDAQHAIANLEEATAGSPDDARYYFHLAAAYSQANRLDDAAEAYQCARKHDLDDALLTDSDRTLLAEVERRFERLAVADQGGAASNE